MKIVKIVALVTFAFASLTLVAQEKKDHATHEEKKTDASAKSNGNAEAMRRNLNYPNAVNPSNNNNPPYDKGTGRVETERPKENLGNTYTRKAIEGPKK